MARERGARARGASLQTAGPLAWVDPDASKVPPGSGGGGRAPGAPLQHLTERSGGLYAQRSRDTSIAGSDSEPSVRPAQAPPHAWESRAAEGGDPRVRRGYSLARANQFETSAYSPRATFQKLKVQRL